MDYLSAFTTTDGLDLDVERNLEKGSVQQVETGVLVPFQRFHVDKERSHTPTSRKVQPNKTGIPRDPPVC